MRGGIPKGGGQATRSCPNRFRWGNGYAPRSIAFKLDGRESHPQRDSSEEIHSPRPGDCTEKPPTISSL